jgi:poly(3-hydroxyalkanoate) depolymerase
MAMTDNLGMRRRSIGERVELVTVRDRTLRIAVRSAEGELADPARTSLLLCNGIGGSMELLQPFVDALGPQREVIRFDLPGIGGSPAPPAPYHLATLPRLVTGLLDLLGQRQADVLGISWGGALAQQLAVACPLRVRRVVLVASGTGMLMVPARPKVLRHLLTPQRHRDPGYAVRMAAQIYGGTLRTNPDRARSLLHPTTGPTGPRRGYYYQLLAGLGWTSLPWLAALDQPTLVLAGDDDPIVPLVNARLMHRLLRRSTLHIYPGGHLELIANPGLLAPLVEEFLDRDIQPRLGRRKDRQL